MRKEILQKRLKKLSGLLSLLMVGLFFTPHESQSQCTATTDGCEECRFGFCYDDHDIIEVDYLSITNATNGCDNGNDGYSDFTGIGTDTVCRNQTFDLFMEIDYFTGARVWVDWNNDGSFTANESAGTVGQGPEEETISIQVPSNAAIDELTMRIMTLDGGVPADDIGCGGHSDVGEIEDYSLTIGDPNQPKSYTGPANAWQVTDSVFKGQKATRNIGFYIGLEDQGCGRAGIDRLFFSTDGSDDPANDITRARVYYHGSQIIGIPATQGSQMGNDVNNPNGNFVINANDSINLGDNFFSLVYDISPNATTNNLVDATLDSFEVNGVMRYPDNSDPAGARPVASRGIQYCDVSSNRGANYLYGIDSINLDNNWYVTSPSQGSGPDYYHYHKNEDSAVVERNTTVTGTYVTGRLNGSNFRAFADWNKDGEFSANEELFFTNEFFGATQQSFQVPCDADTGIVRMRVVSDGPGGRNDFPACGSYGDGEMEDLKLYVKPQAQPQFAIDAPDTFYVNAEDSINNGSEISGTSSVEWDLNNDTAFESSGQSITHVFSDTGSKTIRMRVANPRCQGEIVDTITKSVEVVYPPRPPQVQFNALRYSTEVGNSIKFQDLSEFGPVSWEWSVQPIVVNGDTTHQFVNGTTANSKNPEIRFDKSGVYSVQLVATNNTGSDTLAKSRYITVGDSYIMCSDGQNTSNTTTDQTGILFDQGGPDGKYFENDIYDYNITCGFTINPKCSDSVRITFEELDISDLNCTGGPTDYIRIYDGTSANGIPLHQLKGYPDGFWNGNAPETPITLTAESGAMYIEFKKNNCGIGQGYRASWETFQGADSATTSFVKGNQVNGPDTIYRGGIGEFSSDVQIDGARYTWKLPGGTQIVGNDPSVTQQMNFESGNYEVDLITEYCGVIDTATKLIYINDVTQDPTADFELSQGRFAVGDTLRFNDLSYNGILEWDWRIFPGDAVEYVNGTSPSSPNPEVVVNEAGVYSAELTAYNRVGRSREVKLDYFTIYDICTPGVNNPVSDLSINEVEIKNMDGEVVYSNLSGYESNGYTRFSKNPAELEAGSSYTITLRRNTNFNDVGYAVWFDANKDGNFESSESMFQDQQVSGTSITDTISIPASTSEGLNWLRLASNRANSTMNGCGGNYSGEYEDHRLVISGGAANPDFDGTAPKITLNNGDSVMLSACDTVDNYIGATAMDNVDGNVSDHITVKGDVDSSVQGSYELTYQVADASGNVATKTQVFMVSPDTAAPMISLNGNQTMDHNVFSQYDDPGVDVMDNCGLDSLAVENNVRDSLIGTYHVTYKAFDKAGNMGKATRQVNVVDNEAPKASLKGQDTIRLAVHNQFNDPGVFAVDNYYDSTNVTVSGSVDPDELGTYELTYEVRDVQGNLTTIDRVVIVEDTEAPAFGNLPEDVVQLDVHHELDLDLQVSDNHYEVRNLTVDRGGSFYNNFPDGKADSLGSFTARITYEDGSGNSNTAVVNVNVVDNEAPEINLLTSPVVTLERFNRYEDSLGGTYEVSDNYYSSGEIEVTRSGSYFTEYEDNSFPQGLFEIRYTAEDPSGNVSDVVTRGIDVTNTNVENQADGIGVNVYPNPNQGKFTLDVSMGSASDVEVTIFDNQGKKVKSLGQKDNTKRASYKVDMTEMSSGMYNIRIQTADEVVNKRVTIGK